MGSSSGGWSHNPASISSISCSSTVSNMSMSGVSRDDDPGALGAPVFLLGLLFVWALFVVYPTWLSNSSTPQSWTRIGSLRSGQKIR